MSVHVMVGSSSTLAEAFKKALTPRQCFGFLGLFGAALVPLKSLGLHWFLYTSLGLPWFL